MNVRDEKHILKSYGKIIEFNDLKNSDVTEQIVEGLSGNPIRPMFLVRESKIEIFRNHVVNNRGMIYIPELEPLGLYLINLISKKSSDLEICLQMDDSHFVPDRIVKDDILFFYQRDNQFFTIVKDEYLIQSLKSEYSIFGMVDFSKGTTLLFKKDNYVKQKMRIFHRKIDALAGKYQDLLFITVSDSIILKYSFKLLDEENNFQPDRLRFDRIIEVFKEIRKIVQQIFHMNVYGIFSYGKNKCETSQSYLQNIFHTGILSSEFKTLFDIENTIKNYYKQNRGANMGDLYSNIFLYRAFRFYCRQQHRSSPNYRELASCDWGIRKDIVAMTIPDRPLTFNHS